MKTLRGSTRSTSLLHHIGMINLSVGVFFAIIALAPMQPPTQTTLQSISPAENRVLGLNVSLNGFASAVNDESAHQGQFLQFGFQPAEPLAEQPAAIPDQMAAQQESPSASAPANTAPIQTAQGSLQVFGNQLVDATGSAIELQGVSVIGTEYACAQGWGIQDTPVNQQLISSLQSWNVNAVRIPLNSYCWLGPDYDPSANLNPAFTGQNYRNEITRQVNLLNDAGIVALLDLHWTTNPSWGDSGGEQAPLPDRSAVDFWQSVGQTYLSRPLVIYELFNEPFPESWENWQHCGLAGSCEQLTRTQAWNCWQNGCTIGNYEAFGMTQLLNALRSGGAQQPALVNGIEWSNDARELVQRLPEDPAGNLAVGWHAYNFNRCRDSTCWDAEFRPIAEQFPLILTEFGQFECDDIYNQAILEYLDTLPNSHSFGWSWHVDIGCGGPSLISSFDGTPNAQGQAVRDHYLGL